LFSLRFGSEPLAEIVGLIREAGQEVQLHLHTEWVDEARHEVVPGVTAKMQHLRYFDVDRQTLLIERGASLIEASGVDRPNAFRAGSFAFNRDTLVALARNAFQFDSSYNASFFGADSGVMEGTQAFLPFQCEGVIEYPMTVFEDWPGRLRHAQLGACSYRELESLLIRSADAENPAVVILWHNFECLTKRQSVKDPVVVRRFEKLCQFLDARRDRLDTKGFRGLSPRTVSRQPALIRSNVAKTLSRVVEQGWRRVYA
jgi:hypothetical protein